MLCVISFHGEEAVEHLLCILRTMKKAGGQVVNYSANKSLIIKIESDNSEKFYRNFKALYAFNYQWRYTKESTDEKLDDIDWEKLNGFF